MTGAGYEGMNAILRAPVASTVDVVRALTPFRRRAVPMLWHLGPSSEAGTEEHLRAAGLELYEEEPGMVARLGGELPGSPEGLVIEVVRDAGKLRRFVEVLTGSTTGPVVSSLVRLRAATGLGEEATFQHLLGLLDGRPVATAAVAHGARAAEIQHVVTLADRRRGGIGTAMTAAAMRLAREHGHERAVLTSSPDGERVYRRLGFETVCVVRRFLWQPTSALRGSSSGPG